MLAPTSTLALSTTLSRGLQLVARIRGAGGQVLGGRLAVDVRTGAGGEVTGVISRSRNGEQTLHEADAVILAISIAGEVPSRGFTRYLARRPCMRQMRLAWQAVVLNRNLTLARVLQHALVLRPCSMR